jgi:uncharacterized protein YndB with AHSA1/START domain
MPAKDPDAAKWEGRVFVFKRDFDAPRALVFQAWTDPQHVAAWWGPHGFTNPRCDWDARPGGAIHVDMKGPDGTVYPMNGRFLEIVEPRRLVFTSAALDAAGKPLFEVHNTVTFAEQGGRTTVTIEARVDNVTSGADAYLKGMSEGWAQSLDRLAGHVASTASDREIVATRVFDAPRELVFKAWSDPQHLAQWWGPHGFTTTTHAMEFKPGGVWRFVMHGPDGRDYPNKITFVEIVPPQRIVYEHGGDKDVEPVNFKVTVTFDAEGSRTRLTMRMVFPSAAAREFTVKTYGAIEGLHQTLGRLAEYARKM